MKKFIVLTFLVLIFIPLVSSALVVGENCGFVTTAPTTDPGETEGYFIDTYAWALKVVAPINATRVTEIGWFSQFSSEEANTEVGIYDHNPEDNNPENRLGVANVAKGTTVGWKKVVGLNIAITENTTYWLAAQCDDTTTDTYIENIVDATYKVDRITTNSLPDPWGATGVSQGNIIAIYAVYSTEEPPPVAQSNHIIIKGNSHLKLKGFFRWLFRKWN